MNKYATYGEFPVPRKKAAKGKRVLDKENKSLDGFWEDVEKNVPGLSYACGCYVFCIKAATGIRPWYVGQSKTGFRKECFQPTKINHYHEVINNTEKGTPVLIFVARLTPGDRFTKTLSESEANFVEQHLISLALRNNPELKNTKNTKLVKSVQIPGILNNPQGAPSSGATLLRQILGV